MIELILVLAVLAVLIGLLLGAVQKVRDRAAALDVANSARQVVLATHNYAAAHDGQLPNADGNRPNQGLGLIRALYSDLGHPSEAQVPAPLLRVRADPTLQPTYVDGNRTLPDEAISLVGNPLLYRNGAQITTAAGDGLSQTIAVVTHYSRCGTTAFWPSITAATLGIGGPYEVIVDPTNHRPTFADPMHDDVLPVTSVVNGIPVTVGSQPRTFQPRPLPAACDYRVPQSLTVGGLTVGMADGSVRTVRPEVSPAVFWGAVTPNGGEVLAWDD